MKQLIAVMVGLTLAIGTADAQDNSLYSKNFGQTPSGPTLAQASLIRTIPPAPRAIRVHDVVSIRVEELARTQIDGEMQSRKNANYNAIINDWIRFNGFTKAEKTQASGEDPQVQGQIQQTFRAEGDLETTQRLTFNISATVVDTFENGTVLLEAHKEIRINDEIWLESLTGRVRQEDIGPDNVVLSTAISDLKIVKNEGGHVRDSYKRGWLHRFLDSVTPF